MDWQGVVPVVAAVLGAAVWVFTIIRKQDAQIAELRAEQRSLKETFEQQNQLNNGTLLHLNELHDQRISALEQHYYHAKGNNGG